MHQELTYNCRTCGHKHRASDWEQATSPFCHACGASAVFPSNYEPPVAPPAVDTAVSVPDDIEVDYNGELPPAAMPTDAERRAADQAEAMGEAFAAGTLPDEGRRDDDADDEGEGARTVNKSKPTKRKRK